MIESMTSLLYCADIWLVDCQNMMSVDKYWHDATCVFCLALQFKSSIATKLSINNFVAAQVCGFGEKRNDNVWLAAEGVYLPITETK